MGRAAAFHADVAGHSGQRGHGTEGRMGVVDALHALAHADAGRLGVDVVHGKGLDDLGIQPGDLGGVLQRVLGDLVAQVVEGGAAGLAVHLEGTGKRGGHALGGVGHRLAGRRVPHHPGGVLALAVAQHRAIGLAHEEGRHGVGHEPVLRVQVLADDDVHHAEGQRRIGLSLDGDPLIGDGRRGAQARIHHDDLGAVFAGFHKVAELGGVGVGHVAAPEHHHVRVHIVARVVSAAALAEAQRHAHGGAVVAHDALDIEGGGAISAGETGGRLPGKLRQVARERVEAAGFRAVLRLGGLHALGDLVDGLLPGDLLELAAAALAGALHGMHDAHVLVVGARAQADGAQAAVGVIVAPGHLTGGDGVDLVVLHAGAQMAARGAVHRAASALVGEALLGIGHRAGLGQLVIFALALLGRGAAKGTGADGGRDGQPARALHEGAARDLAVLHDLGGSELLFLFHTPPLSLVRAATRIAAPGRYKRRAVPRDCTPSWRMRSV